MSAKPLRSRPKRSGAVQSMTGFGRAGRRTPLGSVTVELRSTNHRYLEIDQRLPNGLNGLQERFGELIRGGIRRGRVETHVMLQPASRDQRRVTFDEPLLERYYDTLMTLKARFGVKGAVTLEHLLAFPQAVTVIEERVAPERVWEVLRPVVQAAVQELILARRREGAKLTADLRRQLQTIERRARAIQRRLPVALREQRRRLKKRLQELLGSSAASSAAQLEQAAALVRDVDVHEELVRLESHLGYMRQTLTEGSLVGKRLDFIAQELMRETNTLGAKVNDPQATQHVVDIKGCIEKIREQVQNLE
ncbi:MAG: YicC family protein [Candidatus Omnitrophica bacterium CG11_big_fil_rev_8_21_14_0_20_63_9]|nr:MAG: YicC family protein [Candidatus Omnitrophica bacterium CG11_big_fil_rev_8_21_14_0_20_63_9]